MSVSRPGTLGRCADSSMHVTISRSSAYLPWSRRYGNVDQNSVKSSLNAMPAKYSPRSQTYDLEICWT